ncbi:transposable element Tcb2 transposase [Trichonephila clavipes]|nr:transposable element Tcb2 transposase [Trichonephila clavipes]
MRMQIKRYGTRVLRCCRQSQMYREYRESGKISNLRHSCGRKKHRLERDERRLTKITKCDRRATLPQIAADFNAGPSTSVTVRTIYRNIIDMGFRCTLVDCMAQSFTPGPVNNDIGLLMTENTLPDPTYQQGTVRVGGGSVMVWGVYSWSDIGPLIDLDRTLTGDRYVSILSDHLHPCMSIGHSDGLWEFQTDNATPHTSRIATYWLQELYSEFRHFRWPPKSPDMNIIEHI